ncbi:MAG: SulP family inorganic anion transporter [Gemmataceae bacterium]|nr:SulP family inorganic anion transporter [Gemmataceae bacterium]MDW8265285.1 SulP family inorganic anion transporter [Gemmataceae bacterium]
MADSSTRLSPAAAARETVFRLVPALDSLRQYSWRALGSDTIAGLTVATVAVPQAMAYAVIAGLPPQYGLYTAIVMTAVGAVFDSSRQLINGPTNAISIALLSALSAIPGDERIAAAVLMAFLVGSLQTGITLFRLGDLTRYISHAVIVGFTVGASVLLMLDQLKNLLGLMPAGASDDHFLKRFALTLWHGRIHPATMALGIASIVLVVSLRWLYHRFLRRRLPLPLPDLLITVMLMATVVWLFDLDQSGVRIVGTIPAQLPAFQWPQIEWSWVRDLSGSALAIALLGLLEAIAMAKAIAAQTGQKLDINQQCLSEGLANFTGSFFQCFPGSGSLTRSAINQQTGAVSQWSGVISAAAVALTVLLFARFAYYIPYAALAGILMVTATHMVDRRQLLYHLRATRFDAGIVLATAFSAVFISIEFCILIGVVLSFFLYVPRAARIRLTELTLTPERVLRERVIGDPRCERMLIYDLEGEFFFGSAPDLEKHLSAIEERATGGIRVVVLRLKRARNPDAVCLSRLDAFLRRMETRQITVLLCGVRRDLLKGLKSTGISDRLGPQRIFREKPGTWSSTLEAVRHAYDLVNGDLCATCPRRTDTTTETWYYMI